MAQLRPSLHAEYQSNLIQSYIDKEIDQQTYYARYNIDLELEAHLHTLRGGHFEDVFIKERHRLGLQSNSARCMLPAAAAAAARDVAAAAERKARREMQKQKRRSDFTATRNAPYKERRSLGLPPNSKYEMHPEEAATASRRKPYKRYSDVYGAPEATTAAFKVTKKAYTHSVLHAAAADPATIEAPRRKSGVIARSTPAVEERKSPYNLSKLNAAPALPATKNERNAGVNMRNTFEAQTNERVRMPSAVVAHHETMKMQERTSGEDMRNTSAIAQPNARNNIPPAADVTPSTMQMQERHSEVRFERQNKDNRKISTAVAAHTETMNDRRHEVRASHRNALEVQKATLEEMKQRGSDFKNMCSTPSHLEEQYQEAQMEQVLVETGTENAFVEERVELPQNTVPPADTVVATDGHMDERGSLVAEAQDMPVLALEVQRCAISSVSPIAVEAAEEKKMERSSPNVNKELNKPSQSQKSAIPAVAEAASVNQMEKSITSVKRVPNATERAVEEKMKRDMQPRFCGVCMSKAVKERVFYTACGHISCRACAEEFELDEGFRSAKRDFKNPLAACPYCLKRSPIVRLKESETEAEEDVAEEGNGNLPLGDVDTVMRELDIKLFLIGGITEEEYEEKYDKWLESVALAHEENGGSAYDAQIAEVKRIEAELPVVVDDSNLAINAAEVTWRREKQNLIRRLRRENEALSKLKPSDPQRLQFSNACTICSTTLDKRYAFVQCGHMLCQDCTEEMNERSNEEEIEEGPHCIRCDKSSKAIRLFEHDVKPMRQQRF